MRAGKEGFRILEQTKPYQRVLAYLKEGLLSGALVLGDPLPPERELAETLGISRNSVREAIRQIEHMGFLRSSQGAGNFLCCDLQQNLQDSLEMLMILRRMDYRQLTDLRAGLEQEAAELALARITDEQARQLMQTAQRIPKEPLHTAAHLDKQFHDQIAEIAGNELILQILKALSSTIDRFITNTRQRILRDPNRASQLQYAHEEIAQAFLEHDAVLLTLAIRHHFHVVRMHIDTMEQNGAPPETP